MTTISSDRRLCDLRSPLPSTDSNRYCPSLINSNVCLPTSVDASSQTNPFNKGSLSPDHRTRRFRTVEVKAPSSLDLLDGIYDRLIVRDVIPRSRLATYGEFQYHPKDPTYRAAILREPTTPPSSLNAEPLLTNRNHETMVASKEARFTAMIPLTDKTKNLADEKRPTSTLASSTEGSSASVRNRKSDDAIQQLTSKKMKWKKLLRNIKSVDIQALWIMPETINESNQVYDDEDRLFTNYTLLGPHDVVRTPKSDDDKLDGSTSIRPMAATKSHQSTLQASNDNRLTDDQLLLVYNDGSLSLEELRLEANFCSMVNYVERLLDSDADVCCHRPSYVERKNQAWASEPPFQCSQVAVKTTEDISQNTISWSHTSLKATQQQISSSTVTRDDIQVTTGGSSKDGPTATRKWSKVIGHTNGKHNIMTLSSKCKNAKIALLRTPEFTTVESACLPRSNRERKSWASVAADEQANSNQHIYDQNPASSSATDYVTAMHTTAQMTQGCLPSSTSPAQAMARDDTSGVYPTAPSMIRHKLTKYSSTSSLSVGRCPTVNSWQAKLTAHHHHGLVMKNSEHPSTPRPPNPNFSQNQPQKQQQFWPIYAYMGPHLLHQETQNVQHGQQNFTNYMAPANRFQTFAAPSASNYQLGGKNYGRAKTSQSNYNSSSQMEQWAQSHRSDCHLMGVQVKLESDQDSCSSRVQRLVNLTPHTWVTTPTKKRSKQRPRREPRHLVPLTGIHVKPSPEESIASNENRDGESSKRDALFKSSTETSSRHRKWASLDTLFKQQENTKQAFSDRVTTRPTCSTEEVRRDFFDTQYLANCTPDPTSLMNPVFGTPKLQDALVGDNPVAFQSAGTQIGSSS